MVFSMNVFRVMGDLSHTASKCILIWAIHRNKSAEGVSLLTQLLYILVFITRYLDLFTVAPWWSWWNFVLKIFYISSSAYIVWLMMRVYARTREREYAWKLATWSLGACVVSAPLVCLIFRQWSLTTFREVFWTFSIELESVCVLPQLLLLRQTSVPTVLDSYYLVTLGMYRFLYLLNWIVRGATEGYFDPISVIFGIIQTALYIDFAWVYWSRQRVKLRGGGVVDSDDLSKSFLVRRIIGRGSRADQDDDDVNDEDAALAGQENGTIRNDRWGARGISVSADDTLPDSDVQSVNGSVNNTNRSYADAETAGDAQMIDPAHFEDEEDVDDELDAPPTPVPKDDRYKSTESREPAISDSVEDSTATWADSTAGSSGNGK